MNASVVVAATTVFLLLARGVSAAATSRRFSNDVLEAVNEMWYGHDLSPDHQKAINTRLQERLMNETSLRRTDKPRVTNVQVLGLQNCGTDLLNALLRLNFGKHLNYFSAGPDDNMAHRRHGVWKHSNIQDKWREDEAEMKTLKQENVKAIVIVRNPLAWLDSMRETPPKEMELCTIGEEWLSRSCTHQVPGGYESRVTSTTYTSLMDIWGKFNEAYHHANLFGFEDKFILTYEGLIRYPKDTMIQLAKFLGLDEPSLGWNHLPDSAEINRLEALRQLDHRLYLKTFSKHQKSTACSKATSRLMQVHGYDDCEWTLYKFGAGTRGGAINGITL